MAILDDLKVKEVRKGTKEDKDILRWHGIEVVEDLITLEKLSKVSVCFLFSFPHRYLLQK